MGDVSTAKHAALLTQTGQASGHVDDLEQIYLENQTGQTGHVNDLWVALFQQNGATSGQWNDAAYEFLLNLGVPAGHIDDMWEYFWVDLGGSIGPTVLIEPQGSVPTVGFCDYAPAGNCTATRQYVANDLNFTNPANQWLWSIESGTAVITAGQGTATVTVETQLQSADTPFQLKVVATDTVSTDSAERTNSETHYHREDLAVADIVEDVAGTCNYDSGLGETGCTSQSTYSATYTGTPTGYQWSLSAITGGTAVIVGSSTATTCVVETTGGAPSVGYKVTLDAVSEFQTAQLSEDFTQTKNDLPSVAFIGPNVDTTILAQNVAMTPFDVSGRFTAQDAGGYALVGTWPAGLSIDANGVLSGTPTDPVADYNNLQFSASNALPSTALSNLFTVQIAAGETAPVFSGTVPNQDIEQNVAYTLDLRGYFTGSAATYSTTDTLPTGLTLGTDGIITGTPTVLGESLSVTVTATNGAGADSTNLFTMDTWGVILVQTIPEQTATINVAYSEDYSVFFSDGPVETYSINNASWPPGFTIDANTGVVSGTATLLASYPLATVSGDNPYSSVTSNQFDFIVQDAPSGPAFHALTPDPADDLKMVGVLVGTGGLTTTHTSVLYAPDYQGVYQKFPANAPVWSGGRCVLTGGPGTDVVSVHANDGPAGAPLASPVYLQYYPAAQNDMLHSKDFSNASYWTPTGCTATANAVGLTGVPNDGVTVTGSGVVGDNIKTTATLTPTTGTTVLYYRKTGTDATHVLLQATGGRWVEFNAVTLQTINEELATSEIIDMGDVVKVLVSEASGTGSAAWNVFPNRSGGAASIVMLQMELHYNKTIAECRGLGPIFTTTAPTATDQTLYSFDLLNHPTYTDVVNFAEYVSSNPSISSTQSHIWSVQTFLELSERTDNGRGQCGYVNTSDVNAVLLYTDTPGVVDVNRKLGYAAHDASNEIQLQLDGNVSATNINFKSNLAATKFTVANQGQASAMMVRNFQIYNGLANFADAKAILDGLMAP